ncbi:MAG: hypothetical protein WCJ61_05075 [Paludibacter sp.]
MKIYKQFDTVLNSINDWCEKNNVYAIYPVQLSLIPALKEMEDTGELYRVIDLLIEDGYMSKHSVNPNESVQSFYRLTAKGLTLINEEHGFQIRQRTAKVVIFLLIISTLLGFLSFVMQFIDKFDCCL